MMDFCQYGSSSALSRRKTLLFPPTKYQGRWELFLSEQKVKKTPKSTQTLFFYYFIVIYKSSDPIRGMRDYILYFILKNQTRLLFTLLLLKKFLWHNVF